MRLTLLPTGRLLVQDQNGYLHEVGAEHPDFQRLWVQYHQTAKRSSTPMRLFGLLMIAIGIAGWWYNWHIAATQGQFNIKLTILGPLGIFGGLLMLLRPEWAGPLRKDSTPAHKASLFAVIGLMFIASGIDFYLLKQKQSSPGRSFIPWTASMGTPSLPATSTDMIFLAQTYRLASFNQKQNATWEFVPAGESINDWKTMLTVIDRPDARTREELDRLAEGIMTAYKSHGGRVLMAKTMGRTPADVYNYMVVAFDEPANQRYELNFVKIAVGSKNAFAMIYGVRVTDPQDYRVKAKEFLDRNSNEIGRALAAAASPDISRLPRRTF